jgi:hypothetical protein
MYFPEFPNNQPPTISQQYFTSHQQSASSTFLSEQTNTNTSHQPNEQAVYCRPAIACVSLALAPCLCHIEYICRWMTKLNRKQQQFSYNHQKEADTAGLTN